MLITRKHPEGFKLITTTPEGRIISRVLAANTDECWLDVAGTADDGHGLLDNATGEPIVVRFHTDFNLVNKETGEIRYSARARQVQ